MDTLKKKALKKAIQDIKSSKTRADANRAFVIWGNAFGKETDFIVAINEKANKFLFKEHKTLILNSSFMSYYNNKKVDSFTETYKSIILWSDEINRIQNLKDYIDKIVDISLFGKGVLLIEAHKGETSFLFKRKPKLLTNGIEIPMAIEGVGNVKDYWSVISYMLDVKKKAIIEYY